MLRGPINLPSCHLCDIGVLANARFRQERPFQLRLPLMVMQQQRLHLW
jgi:hypothetical protein